MFLDKREWVAYLCANNQIKTEMEVKEILKNLREKNNLTQEQMAERINVTRQAVSRWETGLTQPNPELLKVLSREFGVSINTLLGSPQTLYCQCCGMPLSDDSMISPMPSVAPSTIPTSHSSSTGKADKGDGQSLLGCSLMSSLTLTFMDLMDDLRRSASAVRLPLVKWKQRRLPCRKRLVTMHVVFDSSPNPA